MYSEWEAAPVRYECTYQKKIVCRSVRVSVIMVKEVTLASVHFRIFFSLFWVLLVFLCSDVCVPCFLCFAFIFMSCILVLFPHIVQLHISGSRALPTHLTFISSYHSCNLVIIALSVFILQHFLYSHFPNLKFLVLCNLSHCSLCII